jgi:hypothetical protein
MHLENILYALRGLDFEIRENPHEGKIRVILGDADMTFLMSDLSAMNDPIEHVVRKVVAYPLDIDKLVSSMEAFGFSVNVMSRYRIMNVKMTTDSGSVINRTFSFDELKKEADNAREYLELEMLKLEAESTPTLSFDLQDVADNLTKRGYDVIINPDKTSIQVDRVFDGKFVVDTFTKEKVFDYINHPANIVDMAMRAHLNNPYYTNYKVQGDND